MDKLFDPETQRRVLSAVLIFFCTTAASFALGRWWGAYRAKREWSTKHFLDRIIVSLNNLSDGTLRIRTIFERSLGDVFINSVAVKKVRAAARQTREGRPLLPIAKEDRWFILNFVLNAVAEQFAEGQVRFDAGAPLKPVTYLLFLTSEAVGEDRLRKVRAMLIKKDLLLNFPYADSMPRLEQTWHADRVVTLRQAAEEYRKEPDNFLSMEVYV
jgi:hypothetical protein